MPARRGLVQGLLCWTVLAAATSVVLAQDKGAVVPAEAAIIEFARTHHPELAGLLEALKNSAPKEYRAALLDLDKTRERLDKVRKSAPERHDLELAEWKASSRIRLLAARLAMGGDPALEGELKAAIAERYELRIQLLKDERVRLEKRIAKLDETVAEQERRRTDALEKEFAAVQRGAGLAAERKPKPVKSTEKPGTEKPSVKSPEKSSDAKLPEKASVKPGEKSIQKPVEKPADKSVAKPVDKTKNPSSEKPSKPAVKDPADPGLPIQKTPPVNQSVGPVKQPVKDVP
jgi:hypothetical protein